MPIISYIQEMREEGHKFEAKLRNIARPCLERKIKRDWGYISVDGHLPGIYRQIPPWVQSPAMKNKIRQESLREYITVTLGRWSRSILSLMPAYRIQDKFDTSLS